MLKYGSFVVNFTTAKTSVDVSNVIEAAALPAGSYRIKRSFDVSVGINAYAGLTPFSMEFSNAKNSVNDHGVVVGFTAPIGLALSKQIDERSLTGFIQLIDIGGLVNWRLSGGDLGLPELQLENVVSPGFYVILGLKDKPMSIGFGVQHGPELKKIEQEVNVDGVAEAQIVKRDASAWRIGLTFTYDIPIFNIFQR